MIKSTVFAATLSGVVGGIALGAMVGPVGVAVGVMLGVAVGVAAGQVMAREDAKANARTRELDAIIGITHGRIGAAPLPPPQDDDPELEVMPQSREEWAAEWLTPPPPVVG